MSETGVRILGLQKFVSTLRRAGVDITELKDAHTRAAQTVADRAAELAPRRSGALAGTIRVAKQANKARVMAGSSKVKYAAPIHWGWPRRNIESQPFLTDAAQQTEAVWVAQYLEDVQTALDNVKGA